MRDLYNVLRSSWIKFKLRLHFARRRRLEAARAQGQIEGFNYLDRKIRDHLKRLGYGE